MSEKLIRPGNPPGLYPEGGQMTDVQKLVKNVDRGILDADEALAKEYLSPAERKELAEILAAQAEQDAWDDPPALEEYERASAEAAAQRAWEVEAAREELPAFRDDEIPY